MFSVDHRVSITQVSSTLHVLNFKSNRNCLILQDVLLPQCATVGSNGWVLLEPGIRTWKAAAKWELCITGKWYLIILWIHAERKDWTSNWFVFLLPKCFCPNPPTFQRHVLWHWQHHNPADTFPPWGWSPAGLPRHNRRHGETSLVEPEQGYSHEWVFRVTSAGQHWAPNPSCVCLWPLGLPKCKAQAPGLLPILSITWKLPSVYLLDLASGRVGGWGWVLESEAASMRCYLQTFSHWEIVWF